MVEITSPSNPSFAMIPATIVANAAVGPAIWTLLPPSAEMTNPATIAVKIPALFHVEGFLYRLRLVS